MATNMFNLTGITEPSLDVAALHTKQQAYSTLTNGATNASTATNTAVNTTLTTNNGEAATSFQATVTGPGSIVEHLGELQVAAAKTVTAYATAAVGGGGVQSAMRATAANYATTYDNLNWLERIFLGSQVIDDAKAKLLSLETLGHDRIADAFAQLSLPAHLVISEDDRMGRLDEGIDEDWRNLTDPQARKDALQAIADAYADANGYPRIELVFTATDLPDGTYGRYTNDTGNGTSLLQINENYLDDPSIVINTVVHEVEHSGQYAGMDGRTSMTPDEAARWQNMNTPDVRSKGGPGRWDQYNPRPVEVGARESSRDWVNNLTREELQGYL